MANKQHQEQAERRTRSRAAHRLVGRSVTLHPWQVEWLEREADRRGVTVSQLLREVIARGISSAAGAAEDGPTSGAELVAELEASGFVGAWEGWADIGDSIEFARRLRDQVFTKR